ncbi:MAG: hypothetical protein J6A42_02755 [Firmicutes bacterium]|nr:hypothetical protein [Bacillota bacterium]
MSYTIARYALWILLSIPVIVLGFGLCGDLMNGILQESRDKKAKKDAKLAKEQQRKSFEEEYRRSRDSGL